MKPVASGNHLRAALAVILFALPAFSCATSISGAIANDAGEPLPSASLSINGESVTVEKSGAFSTDVAAQDIYTIRISAPGHFSFIQTFSRADLELSGGDGLTVPTIKLVAKTKGRRLLVFGGDTMMARRFVKPRYGEPALVRTESAEADMKSVLQYMRPYLELAEFASVNLETQLSATPLTESLPKSVSFHTHTAIAPALRWAGVDYVALGNNHTFDYLDTGLERTLAALQTSGLAYSGAGTNDNQARLPHVAEVAGLPLYFFSYVGWPGTFEPNQVASATKGGAALGTDVSIKQDMRTIPPAALGVIQYHSGLEYASAPPLAEETQLKLAVDNGADLAIGHHSHVVQGYEVYKGKLLAYSLGNFVFDQYLPSTQAAMLLFVWYDDDRFYRAEVVPLHINGYIPTPATGVLRYDILQRLARLSASESTCLDSSGGHLVVKPCVGDAGAMAAQRIALTEQDPTRSVHRLSALGATPVAPIAAISNAGPYRLGLDLLRRGDFEYAGLFGTIDRTWIEHPSVSIVGTGPKKMRIEVSPDTVTTTGMKVFTRVFSRSSPATVISNITSNGCGIMRFLLQRRPDGVNFGDALKAGPVSEIGQLTIKSGTSNAELSFQLPRTFTRSIRLLIEAGPCDDSDAPVTMEIDDLAVIEWQTPWLDPGVVSPGASKTQATHVQFLR